MPREEEVEAMLPPKAGLEAITSATLTSTLHPLHPSPPSYSVGALLGQERQACWRAVVGAAGPKLLSVVVAVSAEAPGAGTEVKSRTWKMELECSHPSPSSCPHPSVKGPGLASCLLAAHAAAPVGAGARA